MKVFKPSGTCAEEIRFEVEGGIIKEIEFSGGCSGNLDGLAALATGEAIEEVAETLAGITCRNGTSCPDQLSKALQKVDNSKEL